MPRTRIEPRTPGEHPTTGPLGVVSPHENKYEGLEQQPGFPMGREKSAIDYGYFNMR